MFSSPGIDTKEANPTTVQSTGIQSTDPTAQLDVTLNSMKEIPYGTPSYNRAVIWTNGDVGLPDETYSVGYKQVPVDNQVQPFLSHLEAPNVPVTQLSYTESIQQSATQVYESVPNKLLFSLRAPSINEGF